MIKKRSVRPSFNIQQMQKIKDLINDPRTAICENCMIAFYLSICLFCTCLICPSFAFVFFALALFVFFAFVFFAFVLIVFNCLNRLLKKDCLTGAWFCTSGRPHSARPPSEEEAIVPRWSNYLTLFLLASVSLFFEVRLRPMIWRNDMGG